MKALKIIPAIIGIVITIAIISAITPLLNLLCPGLKASFEEAKAGVLAESITDTLSDDATVPMSKDTYKANKELAKAAKEVDDVPWWEAWTKDVPVLGAITTHFGQTTRNANLAKAKEDYEITKAADPVYQEALGNKVGFKFDVKIIVLVLLIIAVICVLLFFLKNKKPRGNGLKPPKFKLPKFGKKERAPVIVADVTPQPAVATTPVVGVSALQGMAPLQMTTPVIQAPVAQTQIQQAAMASFVPTQGPEGRVSTLEVDYEMLLFRQCEYLGIDPMQAIADADGNIQKAWHTTWIMLPPEAKAEMDRIRVEQMNGN